MIIFDLDNKYKLKEGTVIDGAEYTLPIIVRIIDAPAVKGFFYMISLCIYGHKKHLGGLCIGHHSFHSQRVDQSALSA